STCPCEKKEETDGGARRKVTSGGRRRRRNGSMAPPSPFPLCVANESKGQSMFRPRLGAGCKDFAPFSAWRRPRERPVRCRAMDPLPVTIGGTSTAAPVFLMCAPDWPSSRSLSAPLVVVHASACVSVCLQVLEQLQAMAP
ncbi:unnamed protein product, partial [Urochloa humidicola]